MKLLIPWMVAVVAVTAATGCSTWWTTYPPGGYISDGFEHARAGRLELAERSFSLANQALTRDRIDTCLFSDNKIDAEAFDKYRGGIYGARGWVRFQQGKYDDARDDAMKAIDRGAPLGHYVMGFIYSHEKDLRGLNEQIAELKRYPDFQQSVAELEQLAAKLKGRR